MLVTLQNVRAALARCIPGAATDDVNSNASTSVAAGALLQYESPDVFYGLGPKAIGLTSCTIG